MDDTLDVFEYVDPNPELIPCPAKKNASDPNMMMAKINPVNKEGASLNSL